MLYVMIEDIVRRHNEIVEKLAYLRQSHKIDSPSVDHVIPEDPSEIYVTEFEPHHGIITK